MSKSIRRLFRALTLLGLALVAATAAASSAYAADWSIGGKAIAPETEVPISGSGGSFTIQSRVLGTSLSVKCTTESSDGSISSGFKDIHENIKWTVCVVLGPNCSVSVGISEKWKTVGFTIGGSRYEAYVPFTTTTVAAVSLKDCAAAGTYLLKGSFCGEGKPLGTELVAQPVSFSAAINEACKKAGKIEGLTLGSEPATLTGSTTYKLTGAYAGMAWGAK